MRGTAMGRQATEQKLAPSKSDAKKSDAKPASSTTTQTYLEKAVDVLEKFGLKSSEEVPAELIRLLEEVRHVDEPRALAIANTIKYMSSFNQLVRDNVENINVGNRYLEISQMFDSIREDSKSLIGQLD